MMLQQLSSAGSQQISHSSTKIANSPQTVFLGDLPKNTSLVDLYEHLKSLVGDCEIVLKRPTVKYFYYAFCRFNDILNARKLSQDIRFFTINGKTCRALPYDKEMFRNADP